MPYWFDGNNLIGQSAAVARRDRKTRRAFLGLLSNYASGRGGRFVVFFDGDDPDRALPPRGVRVRYSAPFSTDDAIIRQAEGARAGGEIIVVTNDRGLAARSRAAGLKTMDWIQFTRKMSTTPKNPRTARVSEKEIDVDEWSRYFGIDPKTLK